jgi:ubiquinone/menaquinone biosynthesis C-methylase UbiE
MTNRSRTSSLFFDVWSRNYDNPVVQRLFYRPEQDAILRALQRLEPRSVLDVGCGTGQLTRRIKRILPGARVVGCDFSQGMLRRAARRARGLSLVRSDALALPFSDASFEAIVTTEAFHWFPNQATACQEFARVLAPSGRVFASLINVPCDSLSAATRRSSAWSGQPLRWPTRSAMRGLLSDAGLSIQEQTRIPRIPPSWLFPTVLTVASRSA